MVANATLNVRLPEALKARGAAVLDREGLSVSDAVRSLYEYMDKEQRFPKVLRAQSSDDAFQHRRELMQSMIGTLPADAKTPEGEA